MKMAASKQRRKISNHGNIRQRNSSIMARKSRNDSGVSMA